MLNVDPEQNPELEIIFFIFMTFFELYEINA
jgi:hypothetical protein